MPNAIANLAHLSFVSETDFGSTLSGTALKKLRILSETLALSKNVAHTGELDTVGRNRVAAIENNKSAGGAVDFELSFTDFETLIRAALGASITGATAGAGANYFNGNTLSSFYIEKAFTDIARFVGVYGAVIEQLDLNFQANAPVTGQIQFMAQKTGSLAASRGVSYTAPSTDPVMRSGVDVAFVKINDAAIAAAVRSLKLSIKNGLKPVDQLTSEVPTGFTFGDFLVTGSMELYFPDASVYDLIEAQDSVKLEAKVSNSAGAFNFQMPAVRLTGGTPAIRGQGQDVILEVPFLAHKGQIAATDCTIAVHVDPAGA